MKSVNVVCVFLRLVAIVLITVTHAFSESSITGSDVAGWRLPLELSEANTSVIFEVDSTWHLVKGEAQVIKGRVWQEDPQDNQTVHASVKLAVQDMVTGDKKRDKKMHLVMHAATYPHVIFEMNSISGICTF